MNLDGSGIFEKNISLLVIHEIGVERWGRLLRCLADLEQKTAGMLRRSTRGKERKRRGDDETSPLLLFAPDRDREGREFSSVAGGDLFYMDQKSGKAISHRYTIFSEDDVQWWRQLSNRQKGVVISVLERFLRALGSDGVLADFIIKMNGVNEARKL